MHGGSGRTCLMARPSISFDSHGNSCAHKTADRQQLKQPKHISCSRQGLVSVCCGLWLLAELCLAEQRGVCRLMSRSVIQRHILRSQVVASRQVSDVCHQHMTTLVMMMLKLSHTVVKCLIFPCLRCGPTMILLMHKHKCMSVG